MSPPTKHHLHTTKESDDLTTFAAADRDIGGTTKS